MAPLPEPDRQGDRSLFAHQDSIEAAWRVVEGVLDNRTPVHGYEPGTWGPSEANRVLAPDEHWHTPRPAGPHAS